ncbi:MAG: hypothetical protein RSA23_10370 [Carnobacterium sp.]
MKFSKQYLNLSTDELDELEKSFDYIPYTTNHAAITKSLDAMCYHKTLEIAKLKSVQRETNKHEMGLTEMRDYAIKHLK